jgi:signal transduction histidine kinase
VSLSNLSYLLEVVQGDAEVTEALGATLRSVRRMAGLVANFVDIARFEDAAVKPTTARLNVRALLESVIEVHAPSKAKGVAFEIDCPHELEAQFDSGLIERVLHNLFGNSMRYCTTGGRVVLAARRWIESDDGSVEISVANSGPLIPEHIVPNLFGKYIRGNGGKRGMGLYFCRLVADAHGGALEYEPQGGRTELRASSTRPPVTTPVATVSPPEVSRVREA